MAKHLTAVDIQAIVETLYAWEGELSWELLCQRVKPLVGKVPTRQSLSSNQSIKNAFTSAKQRAKSEVKTAPSPSSLKIAGERIKRLETELEVVRKQNVQLLRRFLVWQYNASNAGLHESHLEKPLPAIDRERSDAPAKIVRKRRHSVPS